MKGKTVSRARLSVDHSLPIQKALGLPLYAIAFLGAIVGIPTQAFGLPQGCITRVTNVAESGRTVDNFSTTISIPTSSCTVTGKSLDAALTITVSLQIAPFDAAPGVVATVSLQIDPFTAISSTTVPASGGPVQLNYSGTRIRTADPQLPSPTALRIVLTTAPQVRRPDITLVSGSVTCTLCPACILQMVSGDNQTVTATNANDRKPLVGQLLTGLGEPIYNPAGFRYDAIKSLKTTYFASGDTQTSAGSGPPTDMQGQFSYSLAYASPSDQILKQVISFSAADPTSACTFLETEPTHIDFTINYGGSCSISSVSFQQVPNGAAIDENSPTPGGGDRIFAEKTSPTGPVNDTVAVVVRASPNQALTIRGYDVDDPSSDPLIDPNDAKGPTGNDNFGGTGFALLSNGQNVGYSTNITTDSSGNGPPMLYLKTTHQPGDNFMVAAACPGQTLPLAPEPIPALSITGPIGRSEMLTVWRHLHIEYDRMKQPSSPLDNADPVTRVVSIKPTQTSALVLFTLPDNNDYPRYEGGALLNGSTRYPITNISCRTSSPSYCNEVIATVKGVPPQSAANGQWYIATDDVLPFSTDLDLSLLQNVSDPTQNVFAPAYIQPVISDSQVPSGQDMQNTLTPDFLRFLPNRTNGALSDAVKSSFENKQLDSAYWTVNLVAAFQFVRAETPDPDFEFSGTYPLDRTQGQSQTYDFYIKHFCFDWSTVGSSYLILNSTTGASNGPSYDPMLGQVSMIFQETLREDTDLFNRQNDSNGQYYVKTCGLKRTPLGSLPASVPAHLRVTPKAY